MNVNAVRDFRVLNVWTVARPIVSVSIAAKYVVVRIKRNVISQMENAHARKAGLVLTVVRGSVVTICMALTVTTLANVTQTTRTCAIRLLVNAIVNLDGVAVFATDLVRSLRTGKIVKFLVTARMGLSVHRQMVQSDHFRY